MSTESICLFYKMVASSPDGFSSRCECNLTSSSSCQTCVS